MATIYDVSVLAGVSLATVSRVMNNNTKVSDKTRQKVLDAMASLGYRPNTIAQSLASNCSNSIGVLVSQLDGPFYGPMMTEIETIVSSGTKLNLNYYIDELIDEDRQDEVFDYFRQADSDSIDSALSDLGEEDYTREEIQLMRIKFMSELGN